MILTKTENIVTFWHLVLCLLVLTLLHRRVRQKVRAFFILLWYAVRKCLRSFVSRQGVASRTPTAAAANVVKPLLPKKQSIEAKAAATIDTNYVRYNNVTEQDGQKTSRLKKTVIN